MITRILRIGCVTWQNRSQTRQIWDMGANYLLPYACSCIHDSILFDMQHDRLLKKLNCGLLTPSPGSGVVRVGEVGYPVGEIFPLI